MRIATFNVQNLRLQQEDGRPILFGARDRDTADRRTPELDVVDRKLTARVLKDVAADVVALQEVRDLETLDHFQKNFMQPEGCLDYPFRVCLPGNDGAGLGLALLSRYPVHDVSSHAHLLPADLGLEVPEGIDPSLPIFRRDCLLANVSELALWVCHFKAPLPNPETAWKVRRLEALAVRKLIERRFEDPAQALWLILGDLNETLPAAAGRSQSIAPLKGEFSVDLLERIPQPERWTYYDAKRQSYTRPDGMLASPALARRWPDARPHLVREGLGTETERYSGPRLAGVGRYRPHASDHAALYIDLPGLDAEDF